jgi:hypothetical protein
MNATYNFFGTDYRIDKIITIEEIMKEMPNSMAKENGVIREVWLTGKRGGSYKIYELENKKFKFVNVKTSKVIRGEFK